MDNNSTRQLAREQYLDALRQGQKYYKSSMAAGRYPYPQVLDDIFDENSAAGQVELGLVDIPTDRIVGTKGRGRRSAFAGNFMPLLEPDTEFGTKWISLCTDHLSDVGIHDPIRCYEYMGCFYVLEGNKRVSVLKSYDAPSIQGLVTRIIPAWTEDTEVQVYYEFMNFYRLSRLYQVRFHRPGSYARLQAALGFESDHVWTVEERRHFLSGFSKLGEAFSRHGNKGLAIETSGVLLAWLRIFRFSVLFEKTIPELVKDLDSIWTDVESLAHDQSINLSTAPAEPDRSIVTRLLGVGRESHLNAAFIYTAPPEESRWIMSHESGRRYMQETLGERVTSKSWLCTTETADEVMEQAVADGAQVIFAVTPPLIDACCRVAVRHPSVRVLNCSLSMPYPGVRTYHSRLYEVKFLAGLVAGAMAGDRPIGYVADSPIFGAPASINAFLLGAQMVNPRARIKLGWTCLEDDPAARLIGEGAAVLSQQEGIVRPRVTRDWSLCQVGGNGELIPLATTRWKWGHFYIRVIETIFNGAWTNTGSESYKAINYWWGLNSGVIDLNLAENLPEGLSWLTGVVRQGMIDGSAEIFHNFLRDQNGIVRNEGGHGLSPEEIMRMDWLCEGIEGHIPDYDELRDIARPLVRYLGLYRDSIPPEKEETQL